MEEKSSVMTSVSISLRLEMEIVGNLIVGEENNFWHLTRNRDNQKWENLKADTKVRNLVIMT